MGVVNVTPDSFSDGGRFYDPAAAIAHGHQLLRDGADILDVGGEATSPRAQPVDAAEELRRVLPVVSALAAAGATVSIDTTKAVVAAAAVAAGARIVNDVSGGRFDAEMAAAVAATDATYIAGHLRGRTLAEVFAAEAPASWREVAAELDDALAALPAELRARTWVDPGSRLRQGRRPRGEPRLAPPRRRPRACARLPGRRRAEPQALPEAAARRRAERGGSRRGLRGRLPRGRPCGRARASRAQRRLAPPRMDRVHQVVGRALRGVAHLQRHACVSAAFPRRPDALVRPHDGRRCRARLLLHLSRARHDPRHARGADGRRHRARRRGVLRRRARRAVDRVVAAR